MNRMRVSWLAHAKVNLSLEVEPPRPDGYHPYVSYATSVGISDRLDIETGRAEPGVTVVTSSGIEDTLARKAADAVLDAAGLSGLGLDVNIRKAIPPGAGLGGGSADAAAALVAVAELVDRRDLPLLDMAAAIGTDVPFCVVGGCARLHGRGELVDTLPPLGDVGLLVAVPPVHVGTTEVFAAFDRTGPGPEGPAPTSDESWLAGVLPGCSFRNDLEAAALSVCPDLADWKVRIEAVVGGPVRMTGSGAGFFHLAPDVAQIRPVAAHLAEIGVAAWASAPVAHGVERVS